MQGWQGAVVGAVVVVVVAFTGAAAAAPVTFEVEVPSCTPVAGNVMLRSNRSVADAFTHDAMTPVGHRRFRATVDVAVPFDAFRYKYTLGPCTEAACPGVEKDVLFSGSGGDVADRRLAPQASRADDRVAIWRSALAASDATGTRVRSPSEQVAFCGPYLQPHTTDGDVAIGYDAFDAGEVVLEWGPTIAYGQRLVRTGLHRGTFRLSGLAAGETYHYRVIEDGLAGPDHAFVAPPPAGDPLRFAVLGDTQIYGDEERKAVSQVAALVGAFEPHFVLGVGDLVASTNPTGAWEKPEIGRWGELFDRLAPVLARAPFVTAMGNHEEDAPYFWDVFDFPTPDAGKQDHFFVRFGGVHVTVLYTGVTEGYDTRGILDAQTAFLERTLRAANADPRVRWKLVVLHRGIHSEGANHADGDQFFDGAPGLRPWREILRDEGVDLVIAGHNHNLTVAEADGTRFVTTCSGAPPHPLRPERSPATLYAESTCVASLYEVRARTLSFRALRPDGTPVAAAAFDLCAADEDCAELESPCAARQSPSWRCVRRACAATCADPPGAGGSSGAGGGAGAGGAGAGSAGAGGASASGGVAGARPSGCALASSRESPGGALALLWPVLSWLCAYGQRRRTVTASALSSSLVSTTCPSTSSRTPMV